MPRLHVRIWLGQDGLCIDLGKHSFHLHGQDAKGKAVFCRKMSRKQLVEFFATFHACTVVMEACAGSHHMARKLAGFGHAVRLISPQFVRPFVKSNKNDFVDAEAICEASSRPAMRFVSPKTESQQTLSVLHRVRESMVRERTRAINQMHGFLLEFGISLPVGKATVTRLPTVLALEELPPRLEGVRNLVSNLVPWRHDKRETQTLSNRRDRRRMELRSFVAAYLTLMDESAPQRKYELREMFNALRWMARAGAPWRMLPNNFPPWELVYQQTQRWLAAGCFESMVSDLRSIIRVAQGRQGQPSAVILDGRTIQSTCESGPRAGYDGYKRKRGSKVHIAVDTLGQLLAVHVTPANEQERAQVAKLARQVQQATGETVKIAFADQGYTGEDPAQAARDQGIDLQVVKLDEAKKGFVLLPRRWVVERSFGWLNRFRRLARDYERLPETLAGLHFVVFAMLMLVHAIPVLRSS